MTRLDSFIAFVKRNFPDDRLTYQKGIATFHPENTGEAAAIIRMANESGQELFVTGFGNHIDPIGSKFEQLVTLRSDRLNKLINVVPEDFYVDVGAGYPLRELNLELIEQGLFLPHADLPYVGSIAGAIAVGMTAQRQNKEIPLSKFLIRAEIANPLGDILRPGSACFKSVSGLDIVKIYSSSWGLLGMIVSVTLRILPLSLKADFEELVLKAVDLKKFCNLYLHPASSISANYSHQIKRNFDPNNIFPLIAS